jgi:hypothetical protein
MTKDETAKVCDMNKNPNKVGLSKNTESSTCAHEVEQNKSLTSRSRKPTRLNKWNNLMIKLAVIQQQDMTVMCITLQLPKTNHDS